MLVLFYELDEYPNVQDAIEDIIYERNATGRYVYNDYRPMTDDELFEILDKEIAKGASYNDVIQYANNFINFMKSKGYEPRNGLMDSIIARYKDKIQPQNNDANLAVVVGDDTSHSPGPVHKNETDRKSVV